MLEHGGNLQEAIKRFGGVAEDWLDLSTGINPHGYPAPALAPHAWHRLPDSHAELLAAARSYYGAPRLLAVAGTQAAIQALPRLRPSSRVVVAAPSYAEHALHWGRHGHQLRQIPYAELEGAADDCDVLVVCNPNNPTGATLSPASLLAWAAQLAERGGWLIVDEAFADMAPHGSVAPYSDRPGLIVLRSIGKFFGLAGLRLGFVAARASLLAQLADLLGPWTVSGPAQQIGCVALRDAAWQASMREHLQTAAGRLQTLLQAQGIAASGCALFQWWPERQAEAFWRFMAERRIWVRLFPQAAHGIRLGLPADDAGWQRLARALPDWNHRKQT